MTIQDLIVLIRDLKAQNVTLRLDGRQIKFSAPAGAVTPQLRDRMTASRDALTLWLRRGVLRVFEPRTGPAAALAEELRQRPWLSWDEASSVWAYFDYHDDAMAGLTACRSNLLRGDAARRQKQSNANVTPSQRHVLPGAA